MHFLFIITLSAIIRGVASGMYATNSPDVCRYIADDSKTNIVVVEDQKQLDKILKVLSTSYLLTLSHLLFSIIDKR